MRRFMSGSKHFPGQVVASLTSEEPRLGSVVQDMYLELDTSRFDDRIPTDSNLVQVRRTGPK
jgi:hypothetical protein